MSFEEGYEFDDIGNFSALEREHIAHLLVAWTIREIFEFHLVQTDPNFANFRYDGRDSQLKLLDFGATVELPQSVVKTYETLLLHVLENDQDGLLGALVKENLLPKKFQMVSGTCLRVLSLLVYQSYTKRTFFFC